MILWGRQLKCWMLGLPDVLEVLEILLYHECLQCQWMEKRNERWWHHLIGCTNRNCLQPFREAWKPWCMVDLHEMTKHYRECPLHLSLLHTTTPRPSPPIHVQYQIRMYLLIGQVGIVPNQSTAFLNFCIRDGKSSRLSSIQRVQVCCPGYIIY